MPGYCQMKESPPKKKKKAAQTSKVSHRIGIQVSPGQYLQCCEQTCKALDQPDLSASAGAQDQLSCDPFYSSALLQGTPESFLGAPQPLS